MSAFHLPARRWIPSLATSALVLVAPTAANAQVDGARDSVARPIEVQVDARIELLSIAARLAGFPEYDQPNSRSPYADEVEAHFGPLRGHAAIGTLQRLRAQKGISYDAIPSLALHLDGVPALAERVPLETGPERLDARWAVGDARELLVLLRDFAAQSGAAEFFEEHEAFYAEVEKRLHERLATSPALPWFDAFFGARPGARYVAIPGLLCGGGNFGVGVRIEGVPEEITPVFGCSEFDAQGIPVFGDAYLPLYVHELCHTYSNPLVDRFEKELTHAAEQIYATCASKMKRQAYGTPKTLVCETLVRACVVRCRLTTEGKEAANAQAREEVGKHFVWVPDLAKLLGDFESNRAEYPTLADFMPRVIEFFEAWAEKLTAARANAPKVVSIAPANGSTDVDPALDVLTIRFDRPMRDGSWSIVGSSADVPKFRGSLAYDATRQVLTVPIALEPGRTYRFSLNSDEHEAFASEEGVALEPLPVVFTTRG